MNTSTMKGLDERFPTKNSWSHQKFTIKAVLARISEENKNISQYETIISVIFVLTTTQL